MGKLLHNKRVIMFSLCYLIKLNITHNIESTPVQIRWLITEAGLQGLCQKILYCAKSRISVLFYA